MGPKRNPHDGYAAEIENSHKLDFLMNTNKKILHVDDDPAILRLVAQHLKSAGYDPIGLTDPLELSDALLRTDARLVLLDIDMPDIDGLAALRKIKAIDGGIQVIMVTGLVTMCTVLDSMQYGAESCVFKPITDAQPLLSAVESAFDKVDRWWKCLEELKRRKSVSPDQQVFQVR